MVNTSNGIMRHNARAESCILDKQSSKCRKVMLMQAAELYS